MSDPLKHKLSDAIPKPDAEAATGHGGKPHPTHASEAEQAQETQESQDAKNAEASNRERMVNIGRGNQQAGRQGQ